jgi:hypothetical protein
MSRSLIGLFATALYLLLVIAPTNAEATLQSDFNAVCSAGGGTLSLAPNVTITSTQYLNCTATAHSIIIQGASTLFYCTTVTAAPCIVLQSPNIYLRDVSVLGGGHDASHAGSEGIQIQTTADYTYLTNITINGFDVGLHLIGLADLLVGVHSDVLAIGNTNTAIHLEGGIANDYFHQYGLSGQQRVIQFDGNGYSGSGASFVSGWFNTTSTPGVAGVYISSSGGAGHGLTLTDVQDWETACPYAELGAGAGLYINGVSWNGAPITSSDPAFKVTGTSALLRITNSLIGPCGATPTLAAISSTTAAITIGNSDVYGVVNFSGGGSWGTFTANRFLTAPCLSGILSSSVRASANIGCADR